MNILTEAWLGYPVGEYSGTRAGPQQAADAALNALGADRVITERGRALRDRIEATTDTAQRAPRRGR